MGIGFCMGRRSGSRLVLIFPDEVCLLLLEDVGWRFGGVCLCGWPLEGVGQFGLIDFV